MQKSHSAAPLWLCSVALLSAAAPAPPTRVASIPSTRPAVATTRPVAARIGPTTIPARSPSAAAAAARPATRPVAAVAKPVPAPVIASATTRPAGAVARSASTPKSVAIAKPVATAKPAPAKPAVGSISSAIVSAAVGPLTAAPAAPVPQALPATMRGPSITVDFPADGIELKTLIDSVSRVLKIPIVYTNELVENKKLVVRVPVDVPEGALMGILQTALRMNGLALVDSEQRGWKQIVKVQNLFSVARPRENAEAGEPIIEVFTLQKASPADVVNALSPYLTPQPTGSAQAVPGQRAVIVTDYPTVVARIAQIIRLVDVEGRLDTPGARVGLTDNAYKLKAAQPERIDRLMRGILGPTGTASYDSTIDAFSNTLFVAATPEVHARLKKLIAQLDVPVPAEESPIRFYKLKNTKAADVLATISGLFSESGQADAGPEPGAGPPGGPNRPMGFTGNTSPAQGGMIPGSTLPQPAGQTSTSSLAPSASRSALPSMTGTSPTAPASGTSLGTNSRYNGMGLYPDASPGGAGAPGSVRAGNATVAADVNTNSIIVIASPTVQQQYLDLITRLDLRRPQVQIECTIASLQTSDNYTLGVDIGKAGGVGDSRIITFGSFGVSTLDPTNGGLTPVNSTGGTFALLNPSVANLVIRALSGNTNVKLISAPQLLVNDNGKGKLESVSQQPFAEILDTGVAQSRTGLGGQAEAGTTISVEPHISEADYLQLTYNITLSNFVGTGSAGLPPPSQRNTVDSTVTIPDGYTIVVGGLTVKNYSKTVTSIPIIDQIPVIKEIFGSHSTGTSDSTLFVFIRPVILRDDKFEDLKFLSDGKRKDAGVPGDHPVSEPLPMK